MKRKIFLLFSLQFLLFVNLFAQQTLFTSYEDALKNRNNVKTLVLSDEAYNSQSLTVFPNLEWLELLNMGISSFPTEILKLTKLRILKLSKNNIQKIPDEISSLQNLEELYLDSNQNLKSLGLGIGKLSRLSVLDLGKDYGLNLSAEFRILSGLPELKELNISSNSSIPAEISALSSLRDLSITGRVAGGFAGIKLLKNLKGLKLMECGEYDETGRDVSELSELRRLTISDPFLTYIPAEFFKLQELEQIAITAPSMPILPSEIGSLPLLSKLWLTGCKKLKVDSVIESISTIKSLNEVKLDDCNITRISKSIGKLTGITSLDLKSNKIAELSAEIKSLSQLKYLNLNGNPLDDNIIFHLRKKLNACNVVYSSQTVAPKKQNSLEINPPLAKLGVEKGRYLNIIVGELGDTICYPSGTYIIFPPNSLLDVDGKPVKGEIEISFTEYTSAFDLFLSGIPISLDSASKKQAISSAGIISLHATANNQPLTIDPTKPLMIQMVCSDPTEGLSVSHFIAKTGWQKISSNVETINITNIPKPPKEPEFPSNIKMAPFPAVQIKRSKQPVYKEFTFLFSKDTSEIWIERSVILKDDVFSIVTNMNTKRGKYFPEWQALANIKWTYDIEGNTRNTRDFKDLITRSINYGTKGYFTYASIKLKKDLQWFDITFITKDRKLRNQKVTLIARPYAKDPKNKDSIRAVNQRVAKLFAKNYAYRPKLWKSIDSTYDANYMSWVYQEVNKKHAFESYDVNERLKMKDARKYAFGLVVDAYKTDSILVADFNLRQFKKQDSIYKASLKKYSVDIGMYLNTQKGRSNAEMKKWLDYQLARYDTVEGEFIIIRRYPIKELGLWNCFAKYTVSNQESIENPVFTDTCSIMYGVSEAFIINMSDRCFQSFTSLKNITYDAHGKNIIFLVLKNNKMAYVNLPSFDDAIKNPEQIPIYIVRDKASLNTIRSMILGKESTLK